MAANIILVLIILAVALLLGVRFIVNVRNSAAVSLSQKRTLSTLYPTTEPLSPEERHEFFATHVGLMKQEAAHSTALIAFMMPSTDKNHMEMITIALPRGGTQEFAVSVTTQQTPSRNPALASWFSSIGLTYTDNSYDLLNNRWTEDQVVSFVEIVFDRVFCCPTVSRITYLSRLESQARTVY